MILADLTLKIAQILASLAILILFLTRICSALRDLLYWLKPVYNVIR